MTGSANVRSSDAIVDVRNQLGKFSAQIDDALTILNLELRRAIDWLEHECPGYWKTQIRIAWDEVAHAKANLERCLMYPVNDERPSCHEERAEFKKAQAKLAYCQDKQERVRQWTREMNKELFEYEGRMSQIGRLTEEDVPLAMETLRRIIHRIEDYQAVMLQSGTKADSVKLQAELEKAFAKPAEQNSEAKESSDSSEVQEES